jgi:hypothetical protein
MECTICCEEINDINKVITDKNNIYEYCFTCVQYFKNIKINKFIEDFKKEDCLASIKRMIRKGIPFMVDDSKLFLFYQGKNISFLSSTENIKKILDINEKLKDILNLEDDFIKDEALKIINTFVN